MQLKKVEIRSFKRLADPQILFADGKLTAVVGPNEAGKTTLLQALEHLSEEGEIRAAGDGIEITRHKTARAKDIIVEALFRLEESDFTHVRDVLGGDRIRWFYVGRRQDGELSLRVEPPPERDARLRLQVVSGSRRLIGSRWLKLLDESDADSVFDLLTGASDAVDTESETLPSEVLDRLDELLETLRGQDVATAPKYARQLIEAVETLVRAERTEHPAQAAAKALWRASPDFLRFDEEDRHLASEYPLDSVAATPPAALDNLCRLAGLDLSALARARQQGDHGLITTLTEQANARLQAAIATAWSQSATDVRLWLDGGALRVLVQSDGEGYWNIADRSDGMRSFIALAAFLAASERQNPILLIDEAEAHLHYDAQADLVQMLSRQNLARQVIYTTHSAGCLPEDLAAVRIVEPRPQSDTSVIRNWFWEAGAPGFSPLLVGMGAATLAFVPTRYAVIAEGASDFILLPSMIREAVAVEVIGFQTAPGLSEARPAEVRGLGLEAPRIVYLVDNDDAGDAIVKAKLMPAGIDADRIIRSSTRRNWVLEDLLDRNLYVDVLNEELGLQGTLLSVKDLSEPNRPRQVAQWCTARGLPIPSKRAVAQALVRHHVERDARLLSREGTLQVRKLYGRITEVLSLSSGR